MRNGQKSRADAGAENRARGRGAIGRPTEARIPPLELAAMTEEERAMAGVGAANVLRTLARRRDLLTAWLEFGKQMTGGRIPFRTRELLILRVGLRSGCEYEWANHVPGALSAGVTAAEIAALADGAGEWAAADSAVLALVDDLCADDCAAAKTWEALTAAYDEGEIIELLMLIGFYRMNAGFLNSLGVQAEPGCPRLGQGMAYEAPVRPPQPAVGAAGGAAAAAKPDGTWAMKFYHPAGTQELRMVLETKGDAVAGSVTNTALGVTVPIAAGKLEGNRVTCTQVLTKPVAATIAWDGRFDNAVMTGTITINGIGPFPFDGTRLDR